MFQGPEDPAGDIAAEREGYMTGNRVFFILEITLSYQIGQSQMYLDGQTI